MCETVKARCLTFALLVAAAILPGGCGTSSATSLELITVARQGLAMAKDAEQSQHDQQARQLKAQSAALDAAFDADVKLVAAGQLKDSQGKPVAMSPEWVISARKGYAAARDILAEQLRSNEAAHGTRLDNLQAADESLEMATQLIVQQSAIADRVRMQLLEAQKKLLATRKTDGNTSN